MDWLDDAPSLAAGAALDWIDHWDRDPADTYTSEIGIPASGPTGFLRNRTADGIRGFCLLNYRSYGTELATRLKDAEGQLPEEVQFWARLMARLLPQYPEPMTKVTAPPPSGKREYNLAHDLAAHIAAETGIPYERLFYNPQPRGHRATLQEKLKERLRFRYGRPPDRSAVLVVDDVTYTGRTAAACVEAAGRDRVYFLFLVG